MTARRRVAVRARCLDVVRHLPADSSASRVAGAAGSAVSRRTFERSVSSSTRSASTRFECSRLTLRAVERMFATRAPIWFTRMARAPASMVGWPPGWSVCRAVHTFHGSTTKSYSAWADDLSRAQRWLAGQTHTVINVSNAQQAEALDLGVARPGQSVRRGEWNRRRRAGRAAGEREGKARAEDRRSGCRLRRAFDPIKRHEVLVDALAIVAKAASECRAPAGR